MGALSSPIDQGTEKTDLDVRFLESLALLLDSPCMDESATALEPRLGIFFMVDRKLFLESMPTSEGEDDVES